MRPTAANPAQASPVSQPIILYDGVCGLCNRMNQFVLARDREDRFRFASLQSNLATSVLERHGKDPRDLDTVYVVVDLGRPSERLLARSEAVGFVLQHLGGFSRLYGGLLRMLPKPVRDWGYNRVVHIRYRIFGKYETCLLPSERDRRKFLDI